MTERPQKTEIEIVTDVLLAALIPDSKRGSSLTIDMESFTQLATAIVERLHVHSTLGYAIAYPKADYYRIFAGYMGELYDYQDEAKNQAQEEGSWHEGYIVVRVMTIDPPTKQ